MSISYFTSSENSYQWIDITAPTEDELIEIGNKFNIHPYSLKDCLEPDHIPKFELQDNYQFIIARLLIEDYQLAQINTIQQATSKVAIFSSDNFIITIHRLPLRFMEEIKSKYLDRGRCPTPNEVIVRILWYIIQTYGRYSMELAKEIDVFEERIFLKNLSSLMMKNLYYLKRKTHIAYKLLQLTGGVINSIDSKDKIAFHDLRDSHLKIQSEFAQNAEDVNNVLHFYLSISSQKTNEVMRILTVFSAFFLPLTFIVGIYGMNFEWMPELKHKLGYPITWVVMILVTVLIFQWFWRKKWL